MEAADMQKMLSRVVELDGSDLFLVPGAPAMVKVGGALQPVS